MTFTLSNLAELVVALGLLNVWLLRSRLSTPFRGGSSQNLRDEFHAYGLSETIFRLVGTLKISCAIALIAGLWVPALTQPAATIVVILMVGALSMHMKVKDPAGKSIPALFMLLLSLAIILQWL
jgi:hypothetical protein